MPARVELLEDDGRPLAGVELRDPEEHADEDAVNATASSARDVRGR